MGEKPEIISKAYLSLLLVVPDDGRMDYQYLKEMVKDINRDLVSPDERLADEVYHYDAKARVFEKASSFEDRQRAKAQDLEKGSTVAENMPQPMKEKHKNNELSL